MPAASQPLLNTARRAAQRDLALMRETALRIRYDWNEIDPAVRDAADALTRAISGVARALDQVKAEPTSPTARVVAAISGLLE